MGVIDTLSAGYRLISRRWWLLVIPVLLDLFLWLGPRIAVSQAIQEVKGLVTAPAGVELSQENLKALTQMQQLLDQVAEHANLLSLLSAGIPGIPSLIAAASPSTPSWAGVIQVHHIPQAILWSLGLVILGALLGSLYVTWIGRAVLDESQASNTEPLLVQTLHTWLRVLLFLVVIALFLAVLGVPVFLLAGFMLLMSQSIGMILLNLLSILLIWLVIWAAIYLYFVVDAIVINRARLLKAIWNSVNVVIRNFWSTIGLIILINVISGGMMLIWQRLVFAPWGTALGIVANAFIGTGLTAASLIFYNDRYRRWQETQRAANPAFLPQRWNGPEGS